MMGPDQRAELPLGQGVDAASGIGEDVSKKAAAGLLGKGGQYVGESVRPGQALLYRSEDERSCAIVCPRECRRVEDGPFDRRPPR